MGAKRREKFKKMKFYIFTGGRIFEDELADFEIEKDAVVIAADSGYNNAQKLGITPNILLGDLDSIDKSKLTPHELDNLEKIIVPTEKDDTDTQLAVDTAISREAREIVIVGGLGGRLDHTLSTVFLLEYIYDKGVNVYMTDGKNRIRVIKSSGNRVCVEIQKKFKYLSLISLSEECRGVSALGVYYPLENASITRKYSYAVSNVITENCAKVTLLDGCMLIVESRD